MTRDADIELIVRIVLRVLDELDRDGAIASPAAPRVMAPAGSPLRLATERDVLAAEAAGVLRVAHGAVITPLAREAAEAKGVQLVVG